MAELGQLPAEGDSVTRVLFPEHGGDDDEGQEFAFTVTELDGRRVARLRLDRLGAPRPEAAAE